MVHESRARNSLCTGSFREDFRQIQRADESREPLHVYNSVSASSFSCWKCESLRRWTSCKMSLRIDSCHCHRSARRTFFNEYDSSNTVHPFLLFFVREPRRFTSVNHLPINQRAHLSSVESWLHRILFVISVSPVVAGDGVCFG